RIHEEFERAGPAIRGRAKNLERRASELVADRLGKVRSRRLLDELLKAALDRAVSLREDEPAAASIAEDLHLDVSAAFDVALGEDASVGTGVLRLGRRELEELLELMGLACDANASAAAASARLEDEGKPQLALDARQIIAAFDGAVGARHGADPRLRHGSPRLELVAE